jgi:hypothetical protein
MAALGWAVSQQWMAAPASKLHMQMLSVRLCWHCQSHRHALFGVLLQVCAEDVV